MKPAAPETLNPLLLRTGETVWCIPTHGMFYAKVVIESVTPCATNDKYVTITGRQWMQFNTGKRGVFSATPEATPFRSYMSDYCSNLYTSEFDAVRVMHENMTDTLAMHEKRMETLYDQWQDEQVDDE